MRKKRNCKNPLMILAVMVFVVAAPFGATDAMQFKAGENTVIDCDVLVNYNFALRAEGRDKDKLSPNADDANLNFDKWDPVQNKITLLADTDIQYNDFGLFFRARALYDHVYMTDNANDSPMTNNAFQAGKIDSTDEWPDDVKDIYGRDAELLDLFAYGKFRVADRLVNLRIGKQVIQWGESMFIPGGIGSAMAPLDLAALTSVGVELKEFYLPSESVYLQADLTKSIALKTYYQWKFLSSFDPVDETDGKLASAEDHSDSDHEQKVSPVVKKETTSINSDVRKPPARKPSPKKKETKESDDSDSSSSESTSGSSSSEGDSNTRAGKKKKRSAFSGRKDNEESSDSDNEAKQRIRKKHKKRTVMNNLNVVSCR